MKNEELIKVFEAKYLPEIPNSGYGEYEADDGVYKGLWNEGEGDGYREVWYADGTEYKGIL